MVIFRLDIKSRSGQTIIEATIALALIVVVLGAISISVIASLNNSTFLKNQTLAAKYGQSGMEYVKFIRNNDPRVFNSIAAGQHCLPATITSLSGLPCNASDIIDNTFIRQLEIENSSPKCGSAKRVRVTVAWTSSKCSGSFPNNYCHKSDLESCLPNQAPTPIL